MGFEIRQSQAWFLASAFMNHEYRGMLASLSTPRQPCVSNLSVKPISQHPFAIRWNTGSVFSGALGTQRIPSGVFLFFLHVHQSLPFLNVG